LLYDASNRLVRHYVFFRRYGLHDQLSIFLNSVLALVVLFYVYPLKFLFSTLVGQMSRRDSTRYFTSSGQVTELMVLYALGFAAVYFLLAALYWNAWRHRESLALNGLERFSPFPPSSTHSDLPPSDSSPVSPA